MDFYLETFLVRFIGCSFAMAILAVGMVFAQTQIRPDRDIAWPAGCTATSPIYSIYGNLCIGILAQDVSKFGVKADGYPVGCTTTAGSATVACYTSGSFVPHFTTADVGKPIILYGAGPITGAVNLNGMTVGACTGTCSGGTNGRQAITFTDTTDGCSINPNTADPNTYATMPYGWVTVTNGAVAAGTAVQVNPAFAGSGCIHPPTQGTVATITGTFTFTGGSMPNGDLPTTITAVTNANTITVADNATAAANNFMLYGSDDHDAWQTACNSFGQNSGYMTFKGTSLVSHGFTCNGAGFTLEGNGYGNVGAKDTSTIVYAGKGSSTLPGSIGHDWIIEVAQGYGVHLRRFGLRGNTMAKPYGIMPSFGRGYSRTLPGCAAAGYDTGNPVCYVGGVIPTTGNAISQMNKFEYIWAGWAWGDVTPKTGYQLQSCIFANGPIGNNDFATVNNFFCLGAEIGFDGINDQATNWQYNKISAQDNNIGWACNGATTVVDDYFTERNRLDMMMGSPTLSVDGTTSGGCINLDMRLYGGESSAQEFQMGYRQYQNAGTFKINGEAVMSNLGPSGLAMDFSNLGGYGHLSLLNGSSTNPGKILLDHGACFGGQSIDLSGYTNDRIVWNTTSADPACTNVQSPMFRMQNEGTTDGINMVELSMRHGLNPPSPNDIFRDDTFFTNVLGSVQVKSPIAVGDPYPTVGYPAQYTNILPAVTGATTFNYQVTCLDGQGLETSIGLNRSVTPPTPITFTTTSASPLNATQFIWINFAQHEGCAAYVIYGDNGVGGTIGYLTTFPATSLSRSCPFPPVGINSPCGNYPWVGFKDIGQWTKSARVPPPITLSGTIDAEGGYTVKGVPSEINVLSCGAKGDGVTDDGPAIQACITNHPGSTILLPKTQAATAVDYYSSQTLTLTTDGQRLLGSTSGGRWAGASTIKFAPGVKGIHIDTTCGGCALEHLTVEGPYCWDWPFTDTYYVNDADGIWIQGGEVTLDDIQAECFEGNGILVSSWDGTSPAVGNADLWHISNVIMDNNHGHGFVSEGIDSNVGTGQNFNGFVNGRWGVVENSFYGATYISPHTTSNRYDNLPSGYQGEFIYFLSRTTNVVSACVSNVTAFPVGTSVFVTDAVDPSFNGVPFSITSSATNAACGTVISSTAPPANAGILQWAQTAPDVAQFNTPGYGSVGIYSNITSISRTSNVVTVTADANSIATGLIGKPLWIELHGTPIDGVYLPTTITGNTATFHLLGADFPAQTGFVWRAGSHSIYTRGTQTFMDATNVANDVGFSSASASFGPGNVGATITIQGGGAAGANYTGTVNAFRYTRVLYVTPNIPTATTNAEVDIAPTPPTNAGGGWDGGSYVGTSWVSSAVWINPYAEADQQPAKLNGHQMLEGGIMGIQWDHAFSATGATYANSYPYIVQTVGAGNQPPNVWSNGGLTWNSFSPATATWSFVAGNASAPDQLFQLYWSGLPSTNPQPNWYYPFRFSAPTSTTPGGTITVGGRAAYGDSTAFPVVDLRLGVDCVAYNGTVTGTSETLACDGQSGVVILQPNITSVTLSNTAVGASSRIFFTPSIDNNANAPGQALPCATPAAGWAYPVTRTAGVSLTFTVPANPGPNNACWQFWVVN
jgi:hypothetical protein